MKEQVKKQRGLEPLAYFGLATYLLLLVSMFLGPYAVLGLNLFILLAGTLVVALWVQRHFHSSSLHIPKLSLPTRTHDSKASMDLKTIMHIEDANPKIVETETKPTVTNPTDKAHEEFLRVFEEEGGD